MNVRAAWLAWSMCALSLTLTALGLLLDGTSLLSTGERSKAERGIP